jgi:hypothetical protein
MRILPDEVRATVQLYLIPALEEADSAGLRKLAPFDSMG